MMGNYAWRRVKQHEDLESKWEYYHIIIFTERSWNLTSRKKSTSELTKQWWNTLTAISYTRLDLLTISIPFNQSINQSINQSFNGNETLMYGSQSEFHEMLFGPNSPASRWWRWKQVTYLFKYVQASTITRLSGQHLYINMT
jgi:hypothetical protein